MFLLRCCLTMLSYYDTRIYDDFALMLSYYNVFQVTMSSYYDVFMLQCFPIAMFLYYVVFILRCFCYDAFILRCFCYDAFILQCFCYDVVLRCCHITILSFTMILFRYCHITRFSFTMFSMKAETSAPTHIYDIATISKPCETVFWIFMFYNMFFCILCLFKFRRSYASMAEKWKTFEILINF